MSEIRRDLDYLRDIQDAIERVLEYTYTLTWDGYLKDRKTQDAVVRNLEVIGEATKKLSIAFRTQYPSVPWRDLTGTRDRLIHDYFGINQEIVWQIIQRDLPVLKYQISEIISDFSLED